MSTATKIDNEDRYKMLTENSEYGRTISSVNIIRNWIDKGRSAHESHKQNEKKFIDECVKETKKSTCQHALDNANWQACQSFKDPPEKCKDISYSISAKDVFTSSYFWGPVGLFLGILMVTVAFLLLYCLFLRKKNKGKTGGKSKSKASSSQDSGNQKSAESGKKDNGAVNKETSMY